MKYVLITGVSTGIGFDATRYLIDAGYYVFGSVRKEADKLRLEQEFPNNFLCMTFDVSDSAAIEREKENVERVLNGQLLCCLVNNAGVAVPGPLQLLDDEVFADQFSTNVLGTRLVINAFLPLLGASHNLRPDQKPGKIINNSSISGIFNTPLSGAYCVSKHAIESLGEVYRRELLMYGIDVISIQSGPIESEIWNKNIGAMEAYEETDYGTMVKCTNEILEDAQSSAQPAEVISKLIHKIIENPRPKLAYIVHSRPWLIKLLARWVPKRRVDQILYRRLTK